MSSTESKVRALEHHCWYRRLDLARLFGISEQGAGYFARMAIAAGLLDVREIATPVRGPNPLEYSRRCVHRWKIAPPAGEWSPARCELCGGLRFFRNARATGYGPMTIEHQSEATVGAMATR